MINISRPIVFIDFETTGINTQEDRIVEMGVIKLFPDGTRSGKEYKVNPTIPIPASATEIHGISDDDVKDSPKFSQLAKGLLDFITGCDLAGFNSNHFDFPLLYAEFDRCGIEWDYNQHQMVDVGNIFKIKETRTLSAAVQFYCKKEHVDAHSALADIEATVDVFQAQILHYEDLPTTIEELSLYSNFGKKRLDMAGKFTLHDDGITILLNFGKNKGLPAKDDLGFLNWMITKASFPPDTNRIAHKILEDNNFY